MLLSAAGGIAVGSERFPVLVVAAGVVAAPLAFLMYRTRMLVLLVLGAMLAAPQQLPVIISVFQYDVRLGDAVVAGAAFLAVTMGRSVVRSGPVGLTVVVIGYGLLRSMTSFGGAMSYLHVVEPLLMGLLLPMLLPRGYDLWRDVRLLAAVAVLTAPWFNRSDTPRWVGLPGGPNELSLAAVVLIILAVPLPRGSWARRGFVLFGVAGIWMGRSVTALISLAVGLVVVVGLHQARAVASPLWLLFVLPAVGFVVPLVRPDVLLTIRMHVLQASVIQAVLGVVDPVFGTGWSGLDGQYADLFRDTPITGLHNVYLVWFAYLGAVGLFVLLAWLLSVAAASTRVGVAVVVVVAVWVNTTGPFPGLPWGILGIALAAAIMSNGRGSETSAELGDSGEDASGHRASEQRRRVAADVAQPVPTGGAVASV